jgi:ribosome-associated translation inhibitor RaiA
VPLEKLIEKPTTKLTVDLSHNDTPKDNVNKKCRVRVSMPHFETICISELDQNMYVAIDKAHHSIVRQVKRQQNRVRNSERKAS